MSKKRDKNMQDNKSKKPMTRNRYTLPDTIRNTKQEEEAKVT